MGAVAEHILALPAWVALLVVFALPALESSAFVGFLFPGEVALILGGVLAYEGRVSVWAVLAAGISGAIVGDSVGYAVGRRWGRRLLDGTVGRFVKSSHLDRAETYLAQRGGKAVFFGRFTAALRVLIPGLAGMSGLRYRTFLLYNVTSAFGWGVLSVMLGYLGGSSWRHVEHVASRVGLAALGVVVVVVVGAVLLRRTSSRPARRMVTWLASSTAIRRTRSRFPRATGWLLARFEPAAGNGLQLTVSLAIFVVALWTFLGITQDVVSHEELARFDPGAHAWTLTHRTAALTMFFRAATWLGATVVTVPLLAGSGIWLSRRRRSWAPLADIVVVYGSAVLLHAVVELVVQRHRPPVADWLAPGVGWAYPSGHTMQAVAAWGVLALLVTRTSTPRRRLLAVGASLVVSLMVGASRVYLGVHWPTDVLGAACLSTALLALWAVMRRDTLSLRSAPDASGDSVRAG